MNRLKLFIKELMSDLKYDFRLRMTYRHANKVIKEAQMRCRTEGRQFYVLPDPNNKGGFFCISPKERDKMVRAKLLPATFDGLFMIKNAIFIANPNGKHTKKKLVIPKSWLLK